MDWSSGKAPGVHGAQAFDSFVSPVNGEYIQSKHQLKEHEKRNDVVQVGDAFDSKFKELKKNSKSKQNGDNL